MGFSILKLRSRWSEDENSLTLKKLDIMEIFQYTQTSSNALFKIKDLSRKHKIFTNPKS